MRCVLTDLSEKKDYEFTTNNKPVVSAQFELSQIDKNLRTVYIGPRSIHQNEDEKAASSYSVLLTGQPNIQILNSSDFYNSFLGPIATMVPGSSYSQVQLHFATMNAKNEGSVVQDEYTKSGFNKFYYMNDPYFFTIKEMPTVLKEFIFSCEIN